MPALRRLLGPLALLLAAIVGAPAAAQKRADLVRAELVAEPAAVQPGRPFWVGLRLRVKDHWHVYWRNPGDSGLAPEVRWTLPEGAKAGPIVWPVPQRIPVAHLVNFGYEHEVVYLTEITPPAKGAGMGSGALEIGADLSYLVCERECVPGEARLRLSLPVAASPEPHPATRALFEAARAALPQASPWPARLDVSGDPAVLHVAAPGLKAETIRGAFFFPNADSLIEHAAPQALEVGADGLTLRMKRGQLDSGPRPDLGGVLVVEEDVGGATARQAFEIGAAASPAAASAPAATAAPASGLGVLEAALLALLGGMVLNLMPCVFPVLSIKVMSLVEYSGESSARVRLHGLAYTGGVLASFAALAAILLGLRAGGAEIGWGFQLQQPLVVAGLAYLLFAMGLSLSGVFHLGAKLAGAGGALAARPGLQGSFFTGVLATVVASPCTAPFMGAAVGFALTQGATVGLAVFLALGLGLALPFLALTLVPAWLRRLPRPGAWMETAKQAFAFPLYATAAWLIWVLAQQVGPTGLLAALIGLVALGMAAWAFGRSHEAAGSGGRLGAHLARATALAGMLGLAGALYVLEQDRLAPAAPAAGGAQGGSQAAGGFEPFTQARLDALLAEGRPVFVNMTASWCITCLVNERTALATGPVRAAFQRSGLVYLKGDWTNRNPEITRVLERHGRSGVPLYLLYAGRADPVILPQILTEGAVLDTLGGLVQSAPISAPERRAGLR